VSHTIPGGQSKGTPIEEAQDRDLEYWISAKQKRMAEDPNHRYAASDQEWIEAAQTELERRGMEGGPPPSDHDNAAPAPAAAAAPKQVATQAAAQATTQAAAPPRHQPAPRIPPRTGAIQVVGESIAAGGNLMAALQRLQETCILIAPTTAIDALPEGCAIAISMVRVDPAVDGYVIVGDAKSPKPDDHIGLAKSAVESIGAAAGASWIPGITGRADDGRDHHYRHYVAWAEYQDLDGSIRRYNGECEIDLRDGSPQVQDIIRKAKKNSRDPEFQLAEARKFISRQCASKAMLVALRRPGLRHWYPRSVLESKPFAVTKLIFHGRTQDPALKAVFAKIIADRFSGAARQLFGAAPSTPRHTPPPIGTVPIDAHGEQLDDDFPT
jgi:hypothetical protein